jgi:hypothetical protein
MAGIVIMFFGGGAGGVIVILGEGAFSAAPMMEVGFGG